MAGTPDPEWSRRPASRPRLRFLTRLRQGRLCGSRPRCVNASPRLRACTRQQNRTGPPQLQYTTSRALVGRQARRQWSRRLAPRSSWQQSNAPLAGKMLPLKAKIPRAAAPADAVAHPLDSALDWRQQGVAGCRHRAMRTHKRCTQYPRTIVRNASARTRS